MARQREFNPDVVLQRATDYFWEHGYQAASMRDLLAAMQIGRQSLYDTFGDKHSLFLACLARYSDMGQRSMLAPLAAPDGGLSAIRRFFDDSARGMVAPPHRACFMVNSSVEVAPHDPQVAALTQAYIARMHDAFAAALQVAVTKGQLRAHDSDAVAWRLTNAAMGLAALSKSGTPADLLQVVATQVSDSLPA